MTPEMRRELREWHDGLSDQARWEWRGAGGISNCWCSQCYTVMETCKRNKDLAGEYVVELFRKRDRKSQHMEAY